MSGPPVPHPNPVPGSNGIGLFTIGVSPIGTIPSFDFWIAVLSQYANSNILTTLISNFNAYIDQTQDFDSFYDLIWNVLTAQGYGLDVWGNIVGVSRTFQTLTTVKNLGFDEATIANADPWNQSPFYNSPSIQSTFSLTDDVFLRLVLAKATFNITNCSVAAINQLLISLFPNRGNVYVTDGGDMTMTYTFKFPISNQELTWLTQSGVLPKPVGVSAKIIQAV